MEIEVGKYYRRRNGKVVGPVEKTNPHSTHPYFVGGFRYTPHGRVSLSNKSVFDLWEEIPQLTSWDDRLLELASHIAQWSKDPSTKVGCVLADEHNRVVGMGYNGFPRGVDDNPSRYEDRQLKYMLVQHAEANAILNSTGSTKGTTAYVTHHPCANCAGLLIQAGVVKVVCPTPSGAMAERFRESFAMATLMFSESKIERMLK